MRRSAALAMTALPGLAVALWPAAAFACAACAPASERARVAFLITTIVLSLLPLVMIGAGALWLRQRFAGEFTERDSLAPTPR